MNNLESKKVFLATTAMEEFWVTTLPIVFLGEWCLLYERRLELKCMKGRLLSSPYVSYDASLDAHHYIHNLYENLLPQMGDVLNIIHGKQYSKRYWRIVIGPWLQLYLSAVYDRYVYIKHALDQIPNLTSTCLSDKSFVVPVDTLEFTCHLFGDFYNLQLYSKIFSILGKDFPCKESIAPNISLYEKLHQESWIRKCINGLVNAYINFRSILPRTIFLKNSYFPAVVILKFITKYFIGILPSFNKMKSCPRFECDNKKRNILRSVEVENSDFGRCLVDMLCEDIPQCFIEGFEFLESTSIKSYPNEVNAIFSANAWYYDEVFKHWAAKSAEGGVVLAGTQHGADYGTLKTMPSEEHETSILDNYFSWGWSRKDCVAKVIPMPATKLIGRKKLLADNNKDGVLWVGTTAPRYHSIEPSTWNSNFKIYLDWQARFLKALNPNIINHVIFRPHYEDHGWGILRRIKDIYPNMRVDSWESSFRDSLERCRLYVCDHCSTTFAEALSVNKPTILFWNPLANELRADAKPYFDSLRKNGILFDTPEFAADAVSKIYEDVESWWGDPDRQQSVTSFCEQFACTSENTIKLWGDELEMLSG